MRLFFSARLCAAIALSFLALTGCAMAPAARTTEPLTNPPPHLIVLRGGDTLSGTITQGELVRLHVATEGGDTVEIDNGSVSRIFLASSGADITGRYIDADLMEIQKARRAIDNRQARLKAEVESGERRKTDWTLRTPFALILAKLERPSSGIPELSVTLYNFGEKTIALFSARVYCLDPSGRPIGAGGKDHVLEASSAVHISPGEDFTTRLRMTNHPEASEARVQITYVQFADSTWWRGKMELSTL